MAEDPSAAGDVDSSPKKIKVTAVGDSGVGKTCMLMTFANDEFPTDGRIPSLYEGGTIKAGRNDAYEVPVTIEVCNTNYTLGLTDTIGEDEYRRLRELFTSGTDVFLVCFSVADPETLENVKRNWLTEIRILSPKASYILVGTKTDMRENTEVISRLRETNKRPISSQDGVKFANANGAKSYVECSAMNKDGLKDVFEQCVMAATNQQPAKVKDKYKEKHSVGQCAVS